MNRITCYKDGGCGAYEMYSCSECPASKPTYLNKKLNNTQIIGVDMTNESSKDYSAVSSICSNCNTVIKLKVYEPYCNEIDITLFKKCPICNKEFTNYIVNN